MILVQDVHKKFDKVQALAGVGKTTLLRLLVGLLQRDRGSIQIGSIDPAVDPMKVRGDIGFLTDQVGLYERLTTREHLAYFGRLHELDSVTLKRRIDEVVSLLGMEDVIDRRAKGFSQGQRLKVALARTLVHRPRHLLLDEPTRGLDVMSTRALRRVLTTLRAEGCCILMATHVMQEVTHLCDDVVIIAKGQTVAQGSPAGLCEQTGIDNLEDAFVQLTGSAEGQIA
jgi:sodium transport system ATP-binding protein